MVKRIKLVVNSGRVGSGKKSGKEFDNFDVALDNLFVKNKADVDEFLRHKLERAGLLCVERLEWLSFYEMSSGVRRRTFGEALFLFPPLRREFAKMLKQVVDKHNLDSDELERLYKHISKVYGIFTNTSSPEEVIEHNNWAFLLKIWNVLSNISGNPIENIETFEKISEVSKELAVSFSYSDYRDMLFGLVKNSNEKKSISSVMFDLHEKGYLGDFLFNLKKLSGDERTLDRLLHAFSSILNDYGNLDKRDRTKALKFLHGVMQKLVDNGLAFIVKEVPDNFVALMRDGWRKYDSNQVVRAFSLLK